VPTTEEYAYLAGLIDGEGTIRKNGGYWQIKIGMQHKPTIDWLKETFGGSTPKPTHEGVITITKPRLPYYSWWLSAQGTVYETLRQVRPHLLCKATRADEALEDISIQHAHLIAE
jgi:hypothetical protein